MSRHAFIVLLGSTLCASCGPATVESQRDVTKIMCLEQGAKFFPELKAAAERADENSKNEIGNESNMLMGEFRIASTGAFVWSLPAGEFAPHELVCTGDFNRHVINTVTYDGIIRLPGDGEIWSF